MLSRSDPQTITPEQKLRKISFDGFSPNQLPKSIQNYELEEVQGWGNHNWDLNTQSLSIKKQKKTISRQNIIKSICTSRRSMTNDQKPIIKTDRRNQTSKIQQKLISLITRKKLSETIKQMTQIVVPNYLKPRKSLAINKRTPSTSESQSEKLEHNFKKTPAKRTRGNKFSLHHAIRSKSPQCEEEWLKFPNLDFEEALPNKYRQKNKFSLMTSYQPLRYQLKQIPIICYPLIDQSRITVKEIKLNKLNGFFHHQNLRVKPQLRQTSNFPKNQFLAKNQDSTLKLESGVPKRKNLKQTINEK